jgi:hypothetical protein
MAIKLHEVAYLKTTMEPVYVMAFHEPSEMVSVRRPVQGRDGIQHQVEDFSLDELETEQEAFTRDAGKLALQYKLRQNLIVPEAEAPISNVRN